ncbi:helix-turn-helix domain-containing protein [Staphylococcus agnetis]|uniref:helix-turn-helix domain-containing protein n=1 Tax=Staphylococcus agnetis TaxID=985762 RepID=UPI000CD1E1CA|nr:helix-turn-helix domain-containing protein [Staphylococcus agnetis]MBY7664069.1 helix-turn-helix domain-containing protein [Staphylococcus agnetis]NJH68477.1 hypothetical protein [Staphylococcus agnetis]NJH79933.1 hypothetical protein [Staphylococcus agnetis]PNY83848.1 hypothetical protein CD172_11800 [Staphylococcus agnetis]PTH68587.1 hypothetical protein BU582_02110 [Staphylococcus agnetis]
MKTLIQYAYTQASPYKTEKSIYNIIIGKKSHQTFFDAVSLKLFSLYGLNKNLTWDTYQTILEETYTPQNIPTSNEVTYETLTHTFECVQLLIQTLSNMQHQQPQFMPTTSHVHIHEHVRHMFFHIKKNHLETDVKSEIYDVFKALNSCHTTSILHYFLTGYDESMYTPHQVSLIEGMDNDTCTRAIYLDLFYLTDILKDSNRFPILSQCCASLNVSKAVYRTYCDLNNGHSIDQISKMHQISNNTVYDHIVDLFINGYLTDISHFISDTAALNDFIHYYHKHPKQRLKFYKNTFDMFSYFEIKLIIIYISKGVYHAE